MTFANYTDAVLSALEFNPRRDDAIARKQEILDGVYRVENLDPTNDVFVNAVAGTGAVTATAPTAGNPQTGVAVQNGVGRTIYVCSPNQNATQANVAVVTFSSTASVVITPIC